jgi:hypothetical protein
MLLKKQESGVRSRKTEGSRCGKKFGVGSKRFKVQNVSYGQAPVPALSLEYNDSRFMI